MEKNKKHKVLDRIKELVKSIENNPFIGIGNPELLRNDLSGFASRKIMAEHRLVYKVNEQNDVLFILSMRFHY